MWPVRLGRKQKIRRSFPGGVLWCLELTFGVGSGDGCDGCGGCGGRSGGTSKDSSQAIGWELPSWVLGSFGPWGL